MNYHFEILERATCYQGFFRLERCRVRHELYAGGSHEIHRELFERGHAAAVVLYDPVLERLVMIEQFRIGATSSAAGPWMLEFVAGIIEEHEEAQAVAAREAVEEANCVVTELLPIGQFILSPGGCSEHIYLYCGRVDASDAGGIHGLPAEGEDIRVITIEAADVLELVNSGMVASATTLIGLQWFLLNRDTIRAAWG
jgi:ADP-ribose pyrophosphatase